MLTAVFGTFSGALYLQFELLYLQLRLFAYNVIVCVSGAHKKTVVKEAQL